MKKIELEIVALSHSITQTHSYAVVLGEVNGLRRLPIVIGGFEAQAIAVALEKMQPSRPLTHDLMKNFMNAFAIDLHEIIICDLQEGIFYSKLVCSSENDTVEIDSRTSDATGPGRSFWLPDLYLRKYPGKCRYPDGRHCDNRQKEKSKTGSHGRRRRVLPAMKT